MAPPSNVFILCPCAFCGNPSNAWSRWVVFEIACSTFKLWFKNTYVVTRVDDGATGLPRQYFDKRRTVLLAHFVLAFCNGFAVLVFCFFCMCDGRHFRSITLAASTLFQALLQTTSVWVLLKFGLHRTNISEELWCGHLGDIFGRTLHVHPYGHRLNSIFLYPSWTLRTAHG